jgi:hypothetical protein
MMFPRWMESSKHYDVISPAGQPRQWARDRTLYTPEVRFVIISDDADGTPVAKQLTHQEFVDDSDAEVVKGASTKRDSPNRSPLRQLG